MRKILTALLALWPCAVLAATIFTKLPSTPIFIAGIQGRPIPNAAVSILDPTTGLSASDIWMDKDGTQPFNNLVPPDQVVQFYCGKAGIYQVTVSGSGFSKTFYVAVSDAFGSSLRTISIDRTADVLLNTALLHPDLICDSNGDPCYLSFTKSFATQVTFDFETPSFPIVLSYIEMEWFSDQIIGSTSWILDYCTYTIDQPVCNPDTVNRIHITSNVSTTPDGKAIFSATPLTLSTIWPVKSHVVVLLAREPTDTSDTMSGPANLRNIQIEMIRQ